MGKPVYTKQQWKMKQIELQQSHAFKTMDRLESQQRWMMGLMGGLYVLIASIYFTR